MNKSDSEIEIKIDKQSDQIESLQRAFQNLDAKGFVDLIVIEVLDSEGFEPGLAIGADGEQGMGDGYIFAKFGNLLWVETAEADAFVKNQTISLDVDNIKLETFIEDLTSGDTLPSSILHRQMEHEALEMALSDLDGASVRRDTDLETRLSVLEKSIATHRQNEESSPVPVSLYVLFIALAAFAIYDSLATSSRISSAVQDSKSTIEAQIANIQDHSTHTNFDVQLRWLPMAPKSEQLRLQTKKGEADWEYVPYASDPHMKQDWSNNHTPELHHDLQQMSEQYQTGDETR